MGRKQPNNNAGEVFGRLCHMEKEGFSSTLLIYIFFKLLHSVPAKVCEVLTLSQAKWSTFNMNYHI